MIEDSHIEWPLKDGDEYPLAISFRSVMASVSTICTFIIEGSCLGLNVKPQLEIVSEYSSQNIESHKV